MKSYIFTLSFLLHFCANAMEQQTHVEGTFVIKTLVGNRVELPLITRPALAPAYYTVLIPPNETIFKFVKTTFQHGKSADGTKSFTTILAQYVALKKGTTYLQFLVRSNTNPCLGYKWFIVDVE